MRPVVLCFSGLDPSGGAGLQADIETIAAQGAHAAIVCTALTVQDSQRVYGFDTVNVTLMQQQADKILADLPVKAIKCGMLANPEVVAMVRSVCADHPHIPLVLDPVLAANSGGALTVKGFTEHLKSLLPLASVITRACNEPPERPLRCGIAVPPKLPVMLTSEEKVNSRVLADAWQPTQFGS